jgi:hypothetical protein
MFRDQMVHFLGATVLSLLMTNALSVAAATCAIRMMRALVPGGPESRECGGAQDRRNPPACCLANAVFCRNLQRVVGRMIDGRILP